MVTADDSFTVRWTLSAPAAENRDCNTHVGIRLLRGPARCERMALSAALGTGVGDGPVVPAEIDGQVPADLKDGAGFG